MLKF
jgi:hypothetical protein